MLERIHGSVLQQVRAFQRGEKIFFHSGKIFLGNGIARNQDQFNRLGKFMLMQPESFTKQPPGAAANGGIADFFAGDNTQFGRTAKW